MECHACNITGSAIYPDEKKAKNAAKTWRAKHLHRDYSPDFLLE